MSESSTTTTFDAYLPAGFQPTTTPGPVERFLTAPFRRQVEIWLDDE